MSETDAFPLMLSLQVAASAMVIVAPVGIALAWLQARKSYRCKLLVDASVILPLVLPPTVVGYLLIATFGRSGLLGPWLESALDIRVVFTPAAAVIASALVALPLVVKTAQPAIEAVPRAFEDVGRTLGLRPLAVLMRITLPCAWRGIVTGLALAFARAVGEFGATLMFAGNIPGQTNTMPLELYAAFQMGDERRALLYVGLLTAISCAVVLVAARLGPRTEIE